MNEKKAIKLCMKDRDPRGFEFLFHAFKKEAYYHAIAILGHHEDALDACQACFAKAFSGIATLKRLESFYPWFYTILRNHCMNVIRKRKREVDYEVVAVATEEILEDSDDAGVKVWRTLDLSATPLSATAPPGGVVVAAPSIFLPIFHFFMIFFQYFSDFY